MKKNKKNITLLPKGKKKTKKQNKQCSLSLKLNLMDIVTLLKFDNIHKETSKKRHIKAFSLHAYMFIACLYVRKACILSEANSIQINKAID